MKSISIFFSVLSIMLFFSCKKSDNRFDKKYLSDNNYNSLQSITNQFELNLNGNQTLFLIMRDTECYPCLQELEYWNKSESDFPTWNIRLFVVSKYYNTASYLLKREKVTLKSYVDTTYSFLRQDVVPQLPFKLLIKDQEIKYINPMGSGGDIEKFVGYMKN